MLKLLRKFVGKYLSPRIVFFTDVVVSVAASLYIVLLYGALANESVPKIFLLWWSVSALVSSGIMFMCLKTYKLIIRYSTLHEVALLCIASLGKSIMMALFLLIFYRRISHWIVPFDFLLTFGFLILLRVAMFMAYDMLRRRGRETRKTQRILIYGDTEKSISQEIRLRNSSRFEVAGFLVFGEETSERTLCGCRMFSFRDESDLKRLSGRFGIDAVLFSYYADAQEEKDRLLVYCPKLGLQTLIAPSIDIISDGQIPKPIRKIKIEDLLDREEIKISMDEIVTGFTGKTVLVTGAAGSIGSELCRQLLNLGIGELVIFDNAETPMHNLRLEIESRHPSLKFTPVIGDVRSRARLDFVFRKFRPQIVFHAAAYKHVPLMEENPCEAVLVNVVGSRNVADKCIEYDVEKMVMISTDKAVNPTNIMGCTKRLAEIYVQSLGLAVTSGKVAGKTRFVTTRFGNVLGSNGSVIPRFEKQIAAGGPVTVTHPEITRFFMTIPEACRLVMEAATISNGNEICVFDMGESVKIVHLAEQMIQLSGFQVGKDIKIEFTGLRPGEKLYEEVLADSENTLPTSHDRIRIAKVREYCYDNAREIVGELEKLSSAVDIPAMIDLMKDTVPEYHSENL